MKINEAIEYFGSAYQLAKKTKTPFATVYHWVGEGYISPEGQLLIQKLTEGKLKAQYDDLKPR